MNDTQAAMLLATESFTGQEMGGISGHRRLVGYFGQEMSCFSGRRWLIGSNGQEKGLFLRPTAVWKPSVGALGTLGALGN